MQWICPLIWHGAVSTWIEAFSEASHRGSKAGYREIYPGKPIHHLFARRCIEALQAEFITLEKVPEEELLTLNKVLWVKLVISFEPCFLLSREYHYNSMLPASPGRIQRLHCGALLN